MSEATATVASFDSSFDVVVWGGGSGGVAAALQAARSGARTLLLTPGGWLGGMVSAAGVCAPDGNELTPWQTGLWGALLRALGQRESGGLDQNWVSCFGYRPASAEAILREWVTAEPSLQWWPCSRLKELRRRGDRIDQLTLEREGETRRLEPRIVIDGSDRGELFPLAQAPFRFGWEAQELWNEPSAPSAADLERLPFFAEQPVQSPTWVVMGQLAEGQAAPAAAQVPLPAPFERACEAFGLERTLTYGRLPGGLVMLNWPLHGNDWHHDLIRAFGSGGQEADPELPRDLAEAMQAHSLRFAAALEQASGGWLQPGKVFPSASEAASGALEGSSPLALMPYWREGRRLIGQELVFELDLLPSGPGASIAPLPRAADGSSTAIAVGNYANDHHYPGEDWPLAPKSCRWGGRWSGTPFTIPYGALVSSGVVNLLAADKCLSVSHMANGATRLQPLVLNLGQAAGLAAALCVRLGLDPAELPVRRLQEALIDDPLAPAGPFPLWDTPWHHPQWRHRQHRVLNDPSALDQGGCLQGPEATAQAVADAAAAPVPPVPGEQLWQGLLRPDGQGGFQLEREGQGGAESWQVITLEPALHRWLQLQEAPKQVAMVGSANPWGPWLRMSRLA
ncbi:MAG: FAD-dependent oxidoreductase [Cyanobacteriota bacterium]